MIAPVATSTADLVRELERLPARPSAAVRVLWMVDDPTSSSQDLAAAISADPALTARVMRMANASYYGLSGRVSSASFAITVLGFDTVRALAAAAAAGIGSDYPLPVSFLTRAATVAVASALTAPRVGARRPEAYSLGLLHNIGSGLLHRADPGGYAAVCNSAERGADLAEVERQRYGLDSASIGVRVLSAWRFPDEFVAALGAQTAPASEVTTPLGRALLSGLALADLSLPDSPERGLIQRTQDDVCQVEQARMAALAVAEIGPDAAWALAAQVRRESAGLAAALATT